MLTEALSEIEEGGGGRVYKLLIIPQAEHQSILIRTTFFATSDELLNLRKHDDTFPSRLSFLPFVVALS